MLARANQWRRGAKSLFLLEHKWGTITSKEARWSGFQHWGACARRTAFGHAGPATEIFENLLSKSCLLVSYMSAKKLASVGAQNYCEMRKTDAALPTTRLSGTRVYSQGTGSGWPPLGAATGANEPHTQLGLVV